MMAKRAAVIDLCLYSIYKIYNYINLILCNILVLF